EAKYNSQSVTVITKEDIARKQGKSVEDVIFNEVGVTRTVDAMGKVGISIRGADPRHTLIMVDGQPVLGDVSKYSGNGDELMRIGAENIERIEIIRGAASAKYGADAIGGVVNVITKGPKDTMSMEFNAEGRYHSSRYTSPNETSALPSNFYLRADTGKIGNFKAAAWTSKRDILPVYAKDQTHVAHYATGDVTYTNWEKGKNWYDDFKPSLRFYGKETSSGMAASYEFNQNHKIDFRVTREDEDVERRNKTAWEPVLGGSFEEPMRVSKQTMMRDTYAVSYTGKGGNTDWKLDVSHGKNTGK
ncbi:TonB-dependent receptor plug domain-containing protein, partial [Megasphaera cerevisiae]